ncbi:type II toxin-antitoxin system CcdA family antitoxin [Roseobacter sinensis]|uniref:Type II toxin-antitoxin system CcdA family antitoxin n=1 Tax=Roseobacter sinensis TaxID=2931391 RepID=A0ABT3BK52_9RHOB|nr:type II toxin-antitoxin system CcdA family antitoxin [Roseobacter sp. WL0113]MCV3273960.1 type II toxin-antitoxin system CcdA family antitoxin [Roseobacter sp. WL0113]
MTCVKYAHIYAHMPATSRKSTNLSLDATLLQEARALKVNLSRAAERGVRAAVAEARTAAWQAENRGALESSNSYVETHGLPLDRHRNF